jgi:hypothetical protein
MGVMGIWLVILAGGHRGDGHVHVCMHDYKTYMSLWGSTG